MGSLDCRIGALEGYVERRVEAELEAMLELLEANLSAEEFRRVLEIVARADEEGPRGA